LKLLVIEFYLIYLILFEISLFKAKLEMDLAEGTSAKSISNGPASPPKPKSLDQAKSSSSKASNGLALVKFRTDNNNNDSHMLINRFFNETNGKISKNSKRNSKIDVPQQFLTVSLVHYVCNLLNAKNPDLAETRFQG
jgi:hypothetical protein